MNKVLVLMSTYNGEKYVSEQINSILNQEGVLTNLLIRDDGSTDNTKKIIKKFQKKFPSRINILFGKNEGYKKSFMDLVYLCSLNYDYYAFSDQDDVWLNNKLCKAIKLIQDEEREFLKKPILYYSMMTQVDCKLNKMSEQQQFKKVPNYKMILFQNFVQGSTIVFNSYLLTKIRKYKIRKEVSHDIWLPIVTKYIGKIVGDRNSYILYRRHPSAVTQKMKKNYWINLFRDIIKGKKVPTYANELLEGYSDELPFVKKAYLRRVLFYKDINNKFNLFFDNDVRKFSKKGTFLLKLSILFNRLESN